MAALQSYLQDADAILAEANSAPKSGIDQYLADADAILAESQPQPEKLGSPLYEGGKAFLETLGMAARGALQSNVAETLTNPKANIGNLPADYLRRKVVDALPQAADDDTAAQIAQGAGDVAANLAVGGGIQAAVRAPLQAAARAIPQLGRAAPYVAEAAENAIGFASTADPNNPAELAKYGLIGAASGPLGAAGRATKGFKKIAAHGAEAGVIGLGPAVMEGRAPEPAELAMGALPLAPAVIETIAKLGSTSRSAFAKALKVKPDQLPPPLKTAEGRAQAIAEAKQQVESATTPEQVVDQPPAGPEPVGAAPEMQPAPVKQPWEMTQDEFLSGGTEAYKGMPINDWRTEKPIVDIDATVAGKSHAGFFSSDKAVADRFANTLVKKGYGQTVKASLDIKNPLVIDANGRPAKDFMIDGLKPEHNNKEIVDALASGEYDGLIVKNTSDEGTILVPKDKGQIRSTLSHRAQVESAVKEGRPVPAEVLADYPDLKPTTSAEVSPQLPDSPPVPSPPTSIEPTPFDVPSLRTGTKGRGKGARGEFVTEHDDALEAFRTRVRSSGMRPPKNMTGEDFGKAFPLDYIKKDGAYTWDQALQEAAELGLIHPNATPDEFRALFSGKVTRRMQVEPDAATNIERMPKQSDREVANDDMDVGDLVYRNGEWHRVIDATEDGLTLKDGEETQVGYSGTITAKGIVKPGMEEYNYAMSEYRKQEQATPTTSAKQPWEMTRGEFDTPSDMIWLFHGYGEGSHGGKTTDTYVSADPSFAAEFGGPRGSKRGLKAVLVSRSDLQVSPELSKKGVATPEESLNIGEAVIRQDAIRNEIELSSDIANRFSDYLKNPHKLIVEQAISEGRPVPPEVLADYPDLKPTTSAESHTRTAENPPITQPPPPTSNKLMREDVPPQEPVQGEPPPIPERPESTGTKNAVREEQRIARGLEPVESKPGAKHEDLIAEGRKRIEENSALPDEIMARMYDDGKRAIAVGDEAVMLAEASRVHKEYYDTLDKLGDPKLSEAERGVAQKRKTELEGRLNQIDEAERIAGSEWGQFGNLRQRQIREDYSLEAVLRKARAEKGGNLDQKEYDTIKARVKELEDKLEAIQVQKGARPAAEIDAEIDRIIADFDVAPAGGKLGSAASKGKSAVKEFTEAWSELMGGGRLGVTPQAFNEVSYAKAKPHFEKAWLDAKSAGKDLIEFMREEIAKYGRGAKPYLSRFVNENKLEMAPPETDTAIAKMKVKVKKSEPIDVKKQRATIEDRLTARYGEGDVLDEMRPLVQRLALNFVRDGVTAREPLIDQVHGVLKRIDPRATRSQTRDLISGYGEFKPLDKEPAKKTLRELKGEMQQLGKIEDMTAKQAPKKTGVERRAPSDEERRLIKEVNDLKRKGDFATTNPDAQLKSAIDGVKTRLRNEITDLDNAIVDREPLASKKNELQYDTEAKALRAKRDAKKAEYDALFPKKPLPWTEQVKRAGKVLDKQIAELEAAVKSGDVRRKKTFRLNSPELVAQRARLDALRAQRDNLRNMDRLAVEAQKERDLIRAIIKAEAPAKERTKTATPDTKFQASLKKELADLRAKRKAERSDAVALNSYKTRLLNQIADIQERIAKGELEPKKRGKKVFDKDAEATRLEYEANQKKMEINDLLFDYRMKNRTLGEWTRDFVFERVGDLRALKSSIDVSAPGRQGILAGLGHPVVMWDNIKKMFRALGSETEEFRIMQEILNRPNAPEYAQAKLFLHDPTNPKLSTREEAYKSRLSRKIPGIAASERAYTTFLNGLRADLYDQMKASLVKSGFDGSDARKMIANYVNVATGRGGGDRFERTMDGLSIFFFSPRFVLSRFQYAAGQPLYGLGVKDAVQASAARKLIAKEYARTAAGAGLVLASAAAVPGVDVGIDPRSADFGKIVVGNKRYDILGGLSQAVVFASRIMTEKSVSAKGRVTNLTGPDSQKYGARDMNDVIWDFGRSKASPAVQTILEFKTGKDARNRPVSKTEALMGALPPINVEQSIESLREQGLITGTIDTLIQSTGIGVQNYKQ